MWKASKESPIHARTGMLLTTKRSMEAELWFSDLASSLANVMPDVNRRELPACLIVQKVYEMYREGATNRPGKPLEISQFRRMWKCVFPEVTIPKVIIRAFFDRTVTK